MLSTALAINATLYGWLRLTYTIAKSQNRRPNWNGPSGTNPLKACRSPPGSTIILANLMDLTSIFHPRK